MNIDVRQASIYRELLKKFRKGTLTINDTLEGYLGWLPLLPVLLPSSIGMFMIDSEAGWGEAGIKFGFAIFFVPYLLWYLLLFSRSLPKDPPISIKLVRVLGAMGGAAVISFFGFGYYSLLNALTGPDEKVWVSGPVKEMNAESGRWVGKVHEITIRHDGRNVQLTVTPEVFSELRKGEFYGREMKLGGLGYYYTWGVAWWK